MIELKKLKEIINTDRYDQQATQGIGNGMKRVQALDKEDIDESKHRVYAKYTEYDLLHQFSLYDPVKNKKVKAKFKSAKEIIQNDIIAIVCREIVPYKDDHYCQHQKKRKQLEIDIRSRLKISEKAS